VPAAGILKINNWQQLQTGQTQNFTNYNDSSSESCHDSSFGEITTRENCYLCQH